MKINSLIKYILWKYQQNRLGQVGGQSNINFFADIRGNRKNIFLGTDVTICKHASLEVDPTATNKSKIIIGDHTLISSFVMLRTYGGNIRIGHSCFVNSFTVLYGHGDLSIGNGCLIGPQVCIVPVNYGFQDRHVAFRQQTPSLKGIIIEDDVWIGAGTTILDGCSVGTGSIIGAGSVLTKSVEPYSIVGGVPAKLLAKRD